MLIPLQYLQKRRVAALGCPIVKDQEVPDPLELERGL